MLAAVLAVVQSTSARMESSRGTDSDCAEFADSLGTTPSGVRAGRERLARRLIPPACQRCSRGFRSLASTLPRYVVAFHPSVA